MLSERGRATLRQEQRATRLLEAAYPGVRYLPTPKHAPAIVDAVLERDGELVAVAETKCRELTREQLRRFRDEWLITWAKVDAARGLAQAFGVPLLGLLYLVPDDTLLVVRVANADGTLARAVRIEATVTQATVNGGTATRNNAYIAVTGCREVTGTPPS